jgi:hypothetical protein
MKNRQLMFSIAMLAMSLFVASCTTPPAPYRYRPQIVYPDALPPPVITSTAPPALQSEVMGETTVPGYFWIPGVWLWENNRYMWQAGYWSAPRSGYTWVPHHWHQKGHEWHMDGGYWLRSH